MEKTFLLSYFILNSLMLKSFINGLITSGIMLLKIRKLFGKNK